MTTSTPQPGAFSQIAFFALLLALCPLLPQCSQPSGALSHNAISEALQSQRLAITPCFPGWLLNNKDIHPLSKEDKKALIQIVKRGTPRHVPDRYYRSAEEGNRDDESAQLFYVYASDEQCLGARVVKDQVLLDDLDLSEPDAQELYRLLLPYVQLLPQVK